MILAIIIGVLLSIMVQLNGSLALSTSVLYSSVAAHFIGFCTVLLIHKIKYGKFLSFKLKFLKENKLYFFIGIPGAFSVVLASLSVNSSLGLSGTVSLLFLGQVLFGLVCDAFGLFETKKQPLTLNKAFATLLITTGCLYLIKS